MFTLILMFSLRWCTAEITTECRTPAEGFPWHSQEVALSYATRDECLAAIHWWRDAWFPGGSHARPDGVPATFYLSLLPVPAFNCRSIAPAIS